MPEHLSDGKFASKDVTGAGGSEVERKGARRGSRGRPFEKGRAKTGGRQKGTPNKVTRDVKLWMAEIINKGNVQDAIEERICRGDAVAFLRMVEQVIGKPTERREVEHKGAVTITHELAG